MAPDWNNIDRRRVIAAFGTAGASIAAGSSTSAAWGKDDRDYDWGSWKDRDDSTESTLVESGVDRIEATFEKHLDQELHHGAQLAVYHDGEFVIDTAGGVTGPEGAETTTETRHVLFSCTKPYAAACVHLLADRGELDYDDRVIEHWPDFAEEGTTKAQTTIRHVLSHQAGLPTVALDDDAELWSDPDAIAESIENADPVYPPGEDAQYHILSFGWLTGELVRQVTGRRIDRFAREEIFEPLGMDHTSIGLSEEDSVDVATLVGFEPYDQITEPEEPEYNAETAAEFNSDFIQRQAIVPAGNGIGTASDMVRFYACLLNDGKLDGTRLFSPETVEEWTTLHAENEFDPIREAPGRFSLGFFLGGLVQSDFGVTAPETTFGHAGLGSSIAWADPENDIALVYITNGIRDSYEHSTRVGVLGDTARHELADDDTWGGSGAWWD